jgi:hypothetical protein
MIELISGVTYQPGLMNEVAVEEAVSKGKVPQVPMKTAKHKSHELEEKVQTYLSQHEIRPGLTYQSLFVGWDAGTAVEERTVRKYGIPLVVSTTLVSELVVACLGDLQNVVESIADGADEGSPLDDRIVNLEAVTNRTAALKSLVDRAEAHNKGHHAPPLYVEARLYRRWVCDDFIRPCSLSDYRTGSNKHRVFYPTHRINNVSSVSSTSTS